MRSGVHIGLISSVLWSYNSDYSLTEILQRILSLSRDFSSSCAIKAYGQVEPGIPYSCLSPRQESCLLECYAVTLRPWPLPPLADSCYIYKPDRGTNCMLPVLSGISFLLQTPGNITHLCTFYKCYIMNEWCSIGHNSAW